MYVNDKALSLTDNKNSCVEKVGHVMHTNYPLRLYHVPFHKLTVKKLVNVKISREKFTDTKNIHYLCNENKQGFYPR